MFWKQNKQNTSQAKPSMCQPQESQGGRAGLASGTSLLGFSLVFPVSQRLCFLHQRRGFWKGKP